MKYPRLTGAALLVPALMLAGCGSDDPETSDTGADAGADAAADYPSEQIKLYVPYAPGGPTDLAARTTGSCLQEELGQTVVVENRAGASGSLGMQAMLQDGSDGYSLSLIAVPATATNPLQMDVGYTNEDYVPIAAVTQIPSVLAVGKDSEYSSAEELFDAARANPGDVNVAIPGATTSQAMEIRRLGDLYDVELTGVPFNGNAEMTTALLGGNVDAVFINASADVLQNIEAGSFVPLAQSPAERVSYLEDVPTLAELDFPELTSSVSVFGLSAPADTPTAIVEKLEATVETCLEKPEVIKQLDERYVPEEFVGTAAFEERIADIVEAYGPILEKN